MLLALPDLLKIYALFTGNVYTFVRFLRIAIPSNEQRYNAALQLTP